MAKVIQNPADVVPDEVLATAIRDLSSGMTKLMKGPLRRDTIVLLLHDMSKVGKRDIGYVLNSIEALERTYLKPKVV